MDYSTLMRLQGGCEGKRKLSNNSNKIKKRFVYMGRERALRLSSYPSAKRQEFISNIEFINTVLFVCLVE